MMRINNINVDHGSSYSASDPVVTYPLLMNTSASHISPASVSKNLNLNVNSPTQGCDLMKQLGWPLHDHDSSSNQSINLFRPGSDDAGARRETDCNLKSVSSLGTHKTAYPTLKIDFSESYDGLPRTYMDPCFGSYMAAYEPHGIIQPQTTSNAPAGRLPLPIQLADDGQIYVNAKQYHGILRRRKQRAKLEALNKLAKVRKPYMHESRHRHAMRRIRGPGGRFLNTNQLKKQEEHLGSQNLQTKSYIPTNGSKPPSVPSMMVWGTNLQLMNSNGVTSGNSSSSEVTNLSNPGDVFELSDQLGFADFLGSSSIDVNMLYNGPRPRVPVIR